MFWKELVGENSATILQKNAEISHIEYIKNCAQFQILAQEDSC